MLEGAEGKEIERNREIERERERERRKERQSRRSEHVREAEGEKQSRVAEGVGGGNEVEAAALLELRVGG